MIETVETVQDVDKQLAESRANLRSFEDAVDRHRLMKRLKLSSPAHPVLLFRSLFALLTGLVLVTTVVVLAIPWASPLLARKLAVFDDAVADIFRAWPVPEGLPGLPTLLGLLAVCMLVAWAMTTMAALSMGRDAQMLPWEQKQHQKLVNEITRLTTQKAVMERMRSTPAGARPRINTPVPVSLRQRAGIATPAGLDRTQQSHTPAGGSALGRLQRGGASPSATPPPGRTAQSSNPFSRPPSAVPAAERGGSSPFGPAPDSSPAYAERREEAGGSNPFGGGAGAFEGGGQPASGGGVLARARRGTLKTTPAGAAGRLQVGNRAAAPESDLSDLDPEPAAPSPFGGSEGAASFETADTMPPDAQAKSSNIFGTPPPLNRHATDLLAAGTPATAREDDGPQVVEGAKSYQSVGGDTDDTEVEETTAGFHTKVKLPKWGRIEDRWLEEAVEKVEQLAKTLPIQAHLEFSVETHLPFTLLIARATPSIAMRSMVSFVEYLAGIPTPPRARIEVTSNLDRSFHRNVEAALEPFFGEHFKVELEPGRVEIVFTEPDVSWQDYPILPTE